MFQINSQNLNDLNKQGYSRVFVNNRLKKLLLDEIKNKLGKILRKKKIKADQIIDLSETEFKKNFGHVSQRYFSSKIAKKFENYLKLFFKKINEKIFLHEPPKSHIKFNKKLSLKNLSFYWRIVRQYKQDVGKPHTDDQFWKLLKKNELNIKKKVKKKIKIWIPLYGCDSKNSLKFLSQKFSKKVKLNYIRRNGTKKPSISEGSFNKYKKHFRSSNGKNAVLFNYNIIHYGPVNIPKK